MHAIILFTDTSIAFYLNCEIATQSTGDRRKLLIMKENEINICTKVTGFADLGKQKTVLSEGKTNWELNTV